MINRLGWGYIFTFTVVWRKFSAVPLVVGICSSTSFDGGIYSSAYVFNEEFRPLPTIFDDDFPRSLLLFCDDASPRDLKFFNLEPCHYF